MADMRLGTWKGFRAGEGYERIRRRIQKLGDYYGAALSIAKACQEHRIERIKVIEVSYWYRR